ncbi:MAG: Superoxide dismutase [Mn], partial [uncultured Solirubrobacteraceae bacterium]
GLHRARSALSLRSARAAYQRRHDALPPRQASPDLRRQGQRRPRGHGPGGRVAARDPDAADRVPARPSRRRDEQRRRALQPHPVLGLDDAGRCDEARARRQAGRRDPRDVRLLRRLHGDDQGGGAEPVRLGLGLAGLRRLPRPDRHDVQPGLPDLRRPRAAARHRRLGARLLPRLREPARGLRRRVAERRQLGRRRAALRRRAGARRRRHPRAARHRLQQGTSLRRGHDGGGAPALDRAQGARGVGADGEGRRRRARLERPRGQHAKAQGGDGRRARSGDRREGCGRAVDRAAGALDGV